MKSDKAHSVIPSSGSNRCGHKKFDAWREILTGEKQILHICQIPYIQLSILITILQEKNYYPYFTNEETEAHEARNSSEELESWASGSSGIQTMACLILSEGIICL